MPRITEKDAALIADAISSRSPEGRLDASRRAMTGLFRGDLAGKRDQHVARVLGRLNQPVETEPEQSPEAKALAESAAAARAEAAALRDQADVLNGIADS